MSQSLAHRRAGCTLTVVDASGRPVPGQTVRAELTRHEFLFGCGAFFVSDMLDPAMAPGRRALLETYWEAWRELFNYGTLPFYQGRYEPAEGVTMQERTMRAAKHLRAHGAAVKGHPLCWHTVSAKWLLEKSDAAVLANQLARVRREVGAFRGEIGLWDVINEVVIMPVFNKEDNAITRLCQRTGRVPLVKRLFDAAKETNPDAVLLLNDFNTGEEYRRLIEDCLDAGVPIDVIGIQSHQHQGFWGMDKLHEVLERFSVFGLPLHFTENTFVSGDLMPAHIVDLNDWQVPSWPTTPTGEERQARDLERMIDTLFAHPLVTAFTNWDFTDGAWLGAPAGLVRLDGSRKPSFDLLRQRIRSDWHTRLTLTTDENGCCRVEGFRGEYTLECGKEKASFTLRADCPAQTVVLAP